MLLNGLPDSQKVWEICVIGSGPVGTSLAMELERLGFEVLLLEAGAASQDAAPADDRRAEIVDPERHAPMDIATARALGGTSWTWGGRCVAYDDVDFVERDFVPHSRWPMTHDEIRPWYRQACEYLLCGEPVFEKPDSTPASGITSRFVERWASESRIMLVHREHLEKSKAISVALNCTVTGLQFDAAGTCIDRVRVEGASQSSTIKARQFVLAMGGVETTRFLLNEQRNRPALFGGVDGPLGRYYMGHISGKIAKIVFDRPADIANYDFVLDANRKYYRRRLMLTEAEQIRQKVLNTAFWPDNPAFYDPNHNSGVLSAVFLALVFPPSGRRLLSEGIRLAHIGPRPFPIGAHLANAVIGAPRAAADMYRILRDRFIRKPKKPGFLVPNKGGVYALHYHAEQIPDAQSRITLIDETDRYGMRRAKLDLRFTEQDVDSVITSHEVLDRELRENKIGRLEYLYQPDQIREKVWKQAADGYHQVGTTRMGTDPAESVVDPDLKVHGIENLYVASSSVFPTTGQANSTLLAVAFAMRLAGRFDAVCR